MKLPAPFVARPATSADAGEVAALMTALESSYLDEPDVTDESDVAGWWIRLDLARDTVLVHEQEGTLVAAGSIAERREDVLELDGYVHPARRGRGLGGFLIDWLEGESRRRGRSTLQTGVLAADRAAGRLLLARGFAPVRHFYRMLIDLDGPPPKPLWPDGFRVSSFAPGEEAVLHAVSEEAFADHWGHEPRDLAHWQGTVFGQDWWDPSLVYLVREAGEAVAAEINATRFGMGWVGMIGTRPPWRGRGLGRALLLLAFSEFHGRGERRVGLTVDAGNETGATQLYESVGMRVAWQADVYEKRM